MPQVPAILDDLSTCLELAPGLCSHAEIEAFLKIGSRLFSFAIKNTNLRVVLGTGSATHEFPAFQMEITLHDGAKWSRQFWLSNRLHWHTAEWIPAK